MTFPDGRGKPVVLRQITLTQNEIDEFPVLKPEIDKLPSNSAVKKTYEMGENVTKLLGMYRSRDAKLEQERALLKTMSDQMPFSEPPYMMGGRRYRKFKTMKKKPAMK